MFTIYKYHLSCSGYTRVKFKVLQSAVWGCF